MALHVLTMTSTTVRMTAGVSAVVLLAMTPSVIDAADAMPGIAHASLSQPAAPTVAAPAVLPAPPAAPATAPAVAESSAPPAPSGAVAPAAPSAVSEFPMLGVAAPGEYSYNPSGRREPFQAIVKTGKPGEESPSNLPPLQRVSLTELSLIGIVWGGFGYTAMVQAPDGKGYTIRPGTRVGPNNGVVSSITESAVIVQERFTDVYGNKQLREYVKLLHPKEALE